MARPLGDKQLASLSFLVCIHRLLLTPGREERAMVARGLLRTDEGGACCITPAGLRALADAMDAGRVKDGHQAWADMKKANDDA